MSIRFLIISLTCVSLSYCIDELTTDVICKILQVFRTHCLGTIVITSESIEDDQLSHLASVFVQKQQALHPITFIETTSTLIRSESWEKEPLCQNAVVFHHHPAPSLYSDIKARFFINVFIMVTQYSQQEAHAFLRHTARENIILLAGTSGKTLQQYRWRANNQISTLSLDNTRGVVQPIYLEDSKKGLNLSGSHLKVGLLDYPPYVLINQTGTNHQGIEPSLIHIMSEHLNFTYEYNQASPNEMWGEILGKEGNYTFTGLMGMLVKKEVDVIIGLFYLSYLRWPFMGYTTVYKTNYESFLVPSPQPYAKWKALFYSFTPATWIVTISSALVIIVMLRLVAFWTLSKSVTQRNAVFNDIGFCSLYVIGNLLNIQMQPQNITSNAHRIFLIWWLFGTLILTTGYRSGLISYMTLPFTPPAIDTLQHLSDSQLTKLVFSNFQKGILINSTSKLQKKLGMDLEPRYNLTEIYLLLGSGQFAVESNLDNLLYMAATMYPTKTTTGPKVHLLKETILPVQAAFGLQKGSQLKPYFDRDIQSLVEAGIVDYQTKRFAKKITNWNPKKSNIRVSFTLDNLQGAFYSAALGFSLSLLVFLGEIVYGCYF